MAFTLNLPYTVCYPVTQFARRLRSQPGTAQDDQASYFEQQYRDTNLRYQTHMHDLDVSGKIVLDVGSGLGGRALGWLDLGARHVTNIDINRQELAVGEAILHERYADRSSQVVYRHPDDMTGVSNGDVAILFDSFEHLVDPGALLQQVHGWLRPGGVLWVGSIGWYNYFASHCTERAYPDSLVPGSVFRDRDHQDHSNAAAEPWIHGHRLGADGRAWTLGLGDHSTGSAG